MPFLLKKRKPTPERKSKARFCKVGVQTAARRLMETAALAAPAVLPFPKL
jgi:hypothetical protein